MTRDRFLENRSLILMLHREKQFPSQEIAKLLNFSQTSINRFLTNHGMTPIKMPPRKPIPKSGGPKRRCLSCRKPFEPEQRGLFMCKICRRKDHEGLVW